MTGLGRVLCGLLGPLACALLLSSVAVAADDPEVADALSQQDRLLGEAERNHSLGSVVARYQSRLDRNPTALSHFLLGRALYHDGNKEGAERHMKRALEMDPRFWRAFRNLAILAVERNDFVGALGWIARLEAVVPDDDEARRLKAFALLQTKDWDGAVNVLHVLIAKHPDDVGLRRSLAGAFLEKQDWEGALDEIRPMRQRWPEDLGVRWSYAVALFQTGDLDAALPEAEALARADPTNGRPLGMLARIYAQKDDRVGLVRTLKRMLPLAEGEVKDALAHDIEALEAGAPLRPPKEEAPAAPVDPVPGILARAQDEADVEARRRGLRELYGLLVGREPGAPPTVSIPLGVLQRVHEDLEPDPECRAWVMRLLGRAGAAGNPHLVLYAGFALYDPESDVRRLAAEALGQMGSPAAVVYLRAYLSLVPTGEAATPEDEAELNAARLALVAITRHEDLPGGAETWAGKEDHEAVRADWAAWFRSPEGARTLVEAIVALDGLGEVYPERHLVDLMGEPSFEVAAAAYRVLRKRSMGPPEGVADTPRMKKWWPRFPRVEDADLAPASMPGLVRVVREWWRDVRKDG